VPEGITLYDWLIAGFAVGGLVLVTSGGMGRPSRWWALPCFGISVALILLRERLGVDAPFP
jgi:hypothetical protein